MTGPFFLLALLALLVTGICGIWLLVLAFRVGVLWGLAVFFIPFAVVVFAIRYWSDCKKPFIGQLGGAVAAVIFIVLAMTSSVGRAGQAETDQASLTDVATPSLGSSIPSSGSSDIAVAPVPPRPRPLRVAPPPPRTAARPKLTLGNASDFVGRMIKVTARDGRVLKGYLIDARRDRLVLEQDLSSGVFSFEVAHHDVESIEVDR